MPLLLEQSEDVAELLRLQLAERGADMHHVRTVEEAVQHLGQCAHDTVLVGGEVEHHDWRWIYAAVPDGARVTLWSSHPASRIPPPPQGRRIQAELLLGMPRLAAIVTRLAPDSARPGRGQGQGIA